jgi:ATP-dependent helicase/nuclease subunit A
MDRERRLAVTEFSRDLAVDASAGTGKTATLIARVTNLLLAKKDLGPDDVLLLTFTDKAAAEMKSRVVEGWELLLSASRAATSLEEAGEEVRAWNSLIEIPAEGFLTLDDLRERAGEMADGVGRLSVTTFHSFCRRILLSFPAEAGVDPRFEVLPEGKAADAWDAAFRTFLRSEFGREETDPRWERALSRTSDREAAFGMIRRLCLFHRDLLGDEGHDFGSPADFLEYLRDRHGGAVAWFRAFVGKIADRSHEMAPVLEEALAVLSRGWEAVEKGDLGAASRIAPEGAAAFGFRADRMKSAKVFPRPPGMTPADARDRLRVFWQELIDVPPGDAASRFLIDRARAAARFYEEAQGSGLDFMDLLLRANRLLCGNRNVSKRVSGRFRHILVDEFQDTDPLQAEILDALSAGGPPGRLFLVGDPKQSIYGFRRADVQVYHRFREDLVSRGGGAITLVRNFRSRPDLIAAVNGLFGHVLTGGEDFSPPYSPVVAHRRDAGDGEAVSLFRLEEGVEEATFLCGLVRGIVGKVTVGERHGEPAHPARLRDIAVLYRSDTAGEVLASYRDAFARAGIPCLVPSRKGFFARQEVQDLRMVLSAVDAPADPSARYAALKTIFFGLSDGEILPLCTEGEQAASPRARDALALLERLSGRRGRASLSSLLADLYRESGVEFVAARLPEGKRILQNLAKAAEIASAFEWASGGSVRAFTGEIRRKTEEERPESEFPTFEEGEDAVRISTIHLSKGLEFPVVILANLSRGGRKAPEGLRVDRVRGRSAVIFPGFRTYSAFRRVPRAAGGIPFEEWEAEKQDAEERRLLYVAATRARDRLFLVQGAKGKGSAQDDTLRAALAHASDGGAAACAVTGLPGLRRVFSGEGAVLQVAVREPLPVPAPLPPPPPDLSFVQGWSPPSPAPPPPATEEVTLREFYDRAAGRRFGEKVHRALEAAAPVGAAWPPSGPLPVVWGEGEERRWREICAGIASSGIRRRLGGASLVGTELPLLSCRRGWSREERADLVVRFPEGAGKEDGSAPGEHWVIDYKTGVREEEREEPYREQVRSYMEILAAAWSVPVRGFLWYVETGETVEVTPAGYLRGFR